MSDREETCGLALWIFALATLGSYAYCAVTGIFSGDFFPDEITLPARVLLACVPLALAPYFLCWQLNRLVGRVTPIGRIVVSQGFLNGLLVLPFVWNIAVTYAFGVGVMGREVYDAPSWIKPLIQVCNRLDPNYVAVFFILGSPKKLRFDVTAITLMLVLAYMRASLGPFAYILIALSIKYESECRHFLRRHLVSVALLGVIVPYAVASLYGLRSELRGDATAQLPIGDLLFARLAGRLSSFSNIAYILQESDSLKDAVQAIPPFYYFQQVLGSVVHSSFTPVATPERVLIDSFGEYEGTATYMAGVAGNLILAWFISPVTAILNMIALGSFVVLTLLLARLFGNGAAKLTGMGLLLYPLTSGVSYEFGNLLANLLILLSLCYLGALRIKRHWPGDRAAKLSG